MNGGNGRDVTSYLAPFQLAADPATGPITILKTDPTNTNNLYTFYTGMLPLSPEHNQLVLNWYVSALPTAATYVDMYPVFWNGTISSLAPLAIAPGLRATTDTLVCFSLDVLNVDITTGIITSKIQRYRKTAADNSGTTRKPDAGWSMNFGSAFDIPIAAPNFGVFFFHDGTNDTGSMSLLAEVRWV